MALEASARPRILILRRDNIGDLVCTTPLIDALRARYPQAWLGALVNSYNADVLAGNPALDAVHVYEKLKHRSGSLLSNLFKRLKLASSLRGAKLDYVLAPSAWPQALKMAARLKAANVLSSSPLWESDPRHEVERAFSLGAALGVHGAPGPMRIFPDAATVAAMRTTVPARRPLVAIHISARQEIRRWPLQRYAALAKELARSAAVMLLWSPGAANDPRHPGDDAAARSFPEMENLAKVATPDLRSLIAALSLADRVICPDGGAMHVAAALGKPMLALWADSPVGRWEPWQVPHRVVRPESKNLADLELGPVLDAYAALVEVGGEKDEAKQGEKGVGQHRLG
jgi:ADP-heptose:LPS heptosyltransferase